MGRGGEESELWVDEEDRLDWMAQLKCEFNWGRTAVILVTALVTLEFVSHPPRKSHLSIPIVREARVAHRPDACKIQVTINYLRRGF